jgi:hypothetical protein
LAENPGGGSTSGETIMKKDASNSPDDKTAVSESNANNITTSSIKRTPRMQEAERKLNDARAGLEGAIRPFPSKGETIDLQHIRSVNDINCMTQTIGSTIENYMKKREHRKASRTQVRVFIECWFKKSIPFVQKTLDLARV